MDMWTANKGDIGGAAVRKAAKETNSYIGDLHVLNVNITSGLWATVEIYNMEMKEKYEVAAYCEDL